MIKRNPVVTLLWMTRAWRPFRVENGLLFRVGEPFEIEFWAKSRKATIEEVLHSINTGMPLLEAVAQKDGPGAIAALRAQADTFGRMVARAYA